MGVPRSVPREGRGNVARRTRHASHSRAGAAGRLLLLHLSLPGAASFFAAQNSFARPPARPLSFARSASGMAFTPQPSLRGVFAGAGSDGLAEPAVADAILKLAGKPAHDVTVLYLGTATYDLPGPRERQTARFRDASCKVVSLDVAAVSVPPLSELVATIDAADAIIFSGGNTLFAVDRWFDGGHSDSMDPDSYKDAMIAAASKDAAGDESGAAPVDEASKKGWEYIRVDGFGFLPGLLCPHHDKVQSNGVLRAHDFDAMLLRHPGERGVCIDHWAALSIDGDSFSVLSFPGKGSKWVQDGQVQARLVPTQGKLCEIFAEASEIHKDPRVEVCRRENPP
ncbi:hypothetical protein T484DRAFT_1896694 [Baffinella frigidus]|nr:hypothetical protein T484DRAFT_1896694 [Cryptophyta sp. CCMP2293]